jgi:hypothetical protein
MSDNSSTTSRPDPQTQPVPGHVPGVPDKATVASDNRIPDNLRDIGRALYIVLSIFYGVLAIPVAYWTIPRAAYALVPPWYDPLSVVLVVIALLTTVVLCAGCIGGLFCCFGDQSARKTYWRRRFAIIPIFTFVVACFLFYQIVNR